MYDKICHWVNFISHLPRARNVCGDEHASAPDLFFGMVDMIVLMTKTVKCFTWINKYK